MLDVISDITGPLAFIVSALTLYVTAFRAATLELDHVPRPVGAGRAFQGAEPPPGVAGFHFPLVISNLGSQGAVITGACVEPLLAADGDALFESAMTTLVEAEGQYTPFGIERADMKAVVVITELVPLERDERDLASRLADVTDQRLRVEIQYRRTRLRLPTFRRSRQKKTASLEVELDVSPYAPAVMSRWRDQQRHELADLVEEGLRKRSGW